MEDARIWEFEESLWTADAEHYRESIDADVVMVLPEEPWVFTAEQAIAAVTDTPRWTQVAFSNQTVSRPQEGLIVIGYSVHAEKEGKAYDAWCTSTYRRVAHEDWKVVQHQQTIQPIAELTE